MSRFKAFAIHLGISAGIACLVIAVMLLLWYAPPFFSALGGRHILLILLGVDVTLGPLITLLIFNPRKNRRALTFDLSVIAMLQAAALVYGMSVLFEARPVFVVYSKGSFDLVTANLLSKADLAKAKYPKYRSLPVTGPIFVYTEMPADVKEHNEVVFAAFAGKDLPQFPQYYMPYSEHEKEAGHAAKPLAELEQLNPQRSADIENLVRKNGLADADAGYLPLRAKYQDQAVLVDKRDGRILGLLDVIPWPGSAMFKRAGH